MPGIQTRVETQGGKGYRHFYLPAVFFSVYMRKPAVIPEDKGKFAIGNQCFPLITLRGYSKVETIGAITKGIKYHGKIIVGFQGKIPPEIEHHLLAGAVFIADGCDVEITAVVA